MQLQGGAGGCSQPQVELPAVLQNLAGQPVQLGLRVVPLPPREKVPALHRVQSAPPKPGAHSAGVHVPMRDNRMCARAATLSSA